MLLKKAILFGVVFTFLVSSLFALGGLYITPLVENLHGTPGSVIKFKTNVVNQANVQLTAHIKIRDFYIDGNGNYNMTEFKKYSHSCAPWITTPSLAPIVSAGQAIKVPFTIHIPTNAAGEYFAAILINNTPPNQKGKIIVGVNTAILVKVTIDGRPSTHRISFRGVKLYSTRQEKLPKNAPDKVRNAPYVLEMSYKNVGNAVIGLEGQLRLISNSLHKIVFLGTLDRQKTLAFPDITRTIWIPIDRVLPNGTYRVLISADLGNHAMTSKSFDVELKNQKPVKYPLVKFDKKELRIRFQRPNAFLNASLNVQSLDYRKTLLKAKITGLTENEEGKIVEAPLNKKIFGNLKIYPSVATIYPYSKRRMMVAGKGPSFTPEAGEYYAIIEMKESAIGGEATMVRIPIILSAGKLTKSIALEDFNITPMGSDTEISVRVKNTGNSMTYYAGEIFVTTDKSVAVNKTPFILSVGVLYRGAEVLRSMKIPVKVEKGYNVRLVMYYFKDETFKNTATVSIQEKVK